MFSLIHLGNVWRVFFCAATKMLRAPFNSMMDQICLKQRRKISQWVCDDVLRPIFYCQKSVSFLIEIHEIYKIVLKMQPLIQHNRRINLFVQVHVHSFVNFQSTQGSLAAIITIIESLFTINFPALSSEATTKKKGENTNSNRTVEQ